MEQIWKIAPALIALGVASSGCERVRYTKARGRMVALTSSTQTEYLDARERIESAQEDGALAACRQAKLEVEAASDTHYTDLAWVGPVDPSSLPDTIDWDQTPRSLLAEVERELCLDDHVSAPKSAHQSAPTTRPLPRVKRRSQEQLRASRRRILDEALNSNSKPKAAPAPRRRPVPSGQELLRRGRARIELVVSTPGWRDSQDLLRRVTVTTAIGWQTCPTSTRKGRAAVRSAIGRLGRAPASERLQRQLEVEAATADLDFVLRYCALAPFAVDCLFEADATVGSAARKAQAEQCLAPLPRL